MINRNKILRIMKENPGSSFAMKIDCEEAEYEIIPDLIKHDVLRKIDIIVMETHYGRENEIADAFRKEGFIVYSSEEAPYRTGTLFAVRQKEKMGGADVFLVLKVAKPSILL